MPEKSLHAFATRALITLGLTSLFIVLAALMWHTWSIILLTFMGLLLAIFWRSFIGIMTRYLNIPQAASAGLMLVIFTALFAAFMMFFIPRIGTQAEEFTETFPDAIDTLESFLENSWAGSLVLEQLPGPDEWMPQEMLTGLFDTFSATVGVGTDLVLVFFVALFFALNPTVYRRGLLRLVPPAGKERAETLLSDIFEALQAWLVGRLIAMIAVGVMVTIGLTLLAIPLPLFLGFFAALLDFIPYVGPFFALLPAVLIAFANSPLSALWVIILYFVVQQIESYLIGPLIYEKTVSLPPVVMILAVFIFGSLFGVLGLIVAAPLTATIVVMIEKLYVEQVHARHA